MTVGLYTLGVDSPRARGMEESFNKASGGKQTAFASASGYLGTKMYIEALKRAGTFGTEEVIRAFEGMTWEGPTGAWTMRKKDHQAQLPIVVGEVVGKTRYFSFPYVKPIAIISAEDVSMTPKECGWRP